MNSLTLLPVQPVAARPHAAAEVPSPAQPRPGTCQRPLDHVAQTTEVVQENAYDAAEMDFQRAAAEVLKHVSRDIGRDTTPQLFDLMRMSVLLGYRAQSKVAMHNFAMDVVRVLAKRPFVVHTDVSHAAIELHVRLFYRAMQQLSANGIHSFAEDWQRALVTQLLFLCRFAGEQENPNTNFLLACLRNAIVQAPTDESVLAKLLRYGIAAATAAAGVVAGQAGAATAGLADLANQLRGDWLKPHDWYKEVQQLETLASNVEWAHTCERSTHAACEALLTFSGTTLTKELARLEAMSTRRREKLKAAFNRAGVRQVDNEWDLAFACLDKLHAHVFAFGHASQLERMLHQLHGVLRQSSVPALRFKCIEILRVARQLPGAKVACRVLLHLAGKDAPALVEAVARKRVIEANMAQDILAHAQASFSTEERRQAPPSARFMLGRGATLKLMQPRLLAPTGHVSALQPPPTRRTAVPLLPLPGQPDPAPYRLRLALQPGEAAGLLHQAVLAGDARELEALLRLGLAPDALGRAQPLAATGGANTAAPANLLGGSLLCLAVHEGHRAVVRVLTSPLGQRRRCVPPVAQAEAERTAPKAGAEDVRDTLRRRLRALTPPPGTA